MLLQAEKFEKIMWVRNNIEVKDTSPVGFLPGSLFDKIKWAARPLIDHLGGEEALEMHINSGRIEIQHLGHIRGRDIRNTLNHLFGGRKSQDSISNYYWGVLLLVVFCILTVIAANVTIGFLKRTTVCKRQLIAYKGIGYFHMYTCRTA